MNRLNRPLRVLHVGLRPDIGRGSGVDVAAWPLLTAQAAEGVDVSLLVQGRLDEAAYVEAGRVGVTLAIIPSQRLETLSREGISAIGNIRPDVVHFHSVFFPAHAQLAKTLRDLEIPYFVSPHGGLNLWRGRLKKAIYGAIVEKPYFRRADTIFTLTGREEQLVRSWLGDRGKSPRYIELPNSIPGLSPGVTLWAPPTHPRLITVGRFDVLKKGLDRLVEIARLMPNVHVCAYGVPSRKGQPELEKLYRRGLPENMNFLGPVYGDEKIAAFTSATIYVQLSRDEGFGMAIVEAMRLAVPVAITRGCDISDTVIEKNLGIVLPDDPACAAVELMSAMQDARQLEHWSRAGMQWTIEALAPKYVARRTVSAYTTAPAAFVNLFSAA